MSEWFVSKAERAKLERDRQQRKDAAKAGRGRRIGKKKKDKEDS